MIFTIGGKFYCLILMMWTNTWLTQQIYLGNIADLKEVDYDFFLPG